MNFDHLKPGIHLVNPATTKSIPISQSLGAWLAGADVEGVKYGNAKRLAAVCGWVYASLSQRAGMLRQIPYEWQINGEPLESDKDLPFELDTLSHAERTDKAMQILGNGYWHKENDGAGAMRMRWLNPSLVEPDPNSKTPTGYTNYFYNSMTESGYRRQENVPAEELLRFYVPGLKEFDPDSAASDAYGLPAEVLQNLDFMMAAFTATNGLPPLIAKVSGRDSAPAQREKLTRRIQRWLNQKGAWFEVGQQPSGTKALSISGDVELTTLNLTPQEMETASLTDREKGTVLAVNDVPGTRFEDAANRASAEEKNRQFAASMGQRFELIASIINNDPDIQGMGLQLIVKPDAHPTQKRDEERAAMAAERYKNMGVTTEAALYLVGITKDDFPDGMEIFQTVEETPVMPPTQPAPATAVAQEEDDTEPGDDDDATKAAELRRLRQYVKKGKHHKRPFTSDILTPAEIDEVAKAAPKKRPYDRELRAIEDEGAAQITKALSAQRRCLLKGINADNVHEMLNRPQCADGVEAALMTFVTKAALFGAEKGRETVERDVYGVKALGDTSAAAIAATIGAAEMAIEWEGVNTAATQWAAQYVGDLITAINATTLKRVRAEVAAFTQSKEAMPALIERLTSPTGPFGAKRAQVIAVTETTRAYAEGNSAAWAASDVVKGRQWNTARDELVCPICAPLNGQLAATGAAFNFDGADVPNPPAHPHCRCFITPALTVPAGVPA